MKGSILIAALIMSASLNSQADTFTLNAKCANKVAELSKLLVQGFLVEGQVTSVQVNTTLPQSDDMAPSFVETQVQLVIDGQSDGVTTMTKVFVTGGDCVVVSAEVISE